MRTEFGYERKECSCTMCRTGCEYLPGMLVPADLARMSGGLTGAALEDWARAHLMASPGAVVIKDGQPFRIPTLVPRTTFWGPCHWLVEGRCMIWQDSPYGCAFFTVCDENEVADDGRSRQGLYAVIRDVRENGDYIRLWQMLWDSGFQARPPEEGRRDMLKVL